MEISFQNTEQDYIDFHRAILLSKIKKRILLDLFLILLIAYIYSASQPGWRRFIIVFIIVAAIYVSILYLFPFFRSVSLIRNVIASDTSSLKKKTLNVTAEGLSIVSESKTTLIALESLVGSGANERFIYLILADKKYLLIPKRNFRSDAEIISFLELIRAKIASLKGADYEANLAKGKPPYLLGLLCLIPAIGALWGLGLVLYGVFKYKDKWLIIIGVTGILWTACIYEGTIYYLKSSFGQKHILAAASQNGLDSLAKAVESYKMKNGTYPDSLMQMAEDNSIVLIMDPLRFKDANDHAGTDYKHIEFIYKKAGDHYYLFSSGVDGIANTDDDLYPEIETSDGHKYGLIRK